MSKRLKYLPICIGLACSSLANGVEVQINGFGSMVGGKTISHENLPDIPAVPPFYPGETGRTSVYHADFANDGIYDDQLSFFPDTNIGLQFRFDLGDGLSATTQLMGFGASEFHTKLDWAYVGWQINSEFSVKAGRQRMPLFLYSDSLDVAYGYHWIRGPMEVYNSSLSNFTGVNLTYETVLADTSVRVQVWGGESEGFDPFIDVEQSYKDLIAITVDGEYKDLSFHLMYGLTKYGEEGASRTLPSGVVEDQGLDNGVNSDLASIGLRYDFEKFFVLGEVTYWSSVDTYWPDPGGLGANWGGGWYVSSGVHIGDFTPHITYGSILIVLDESASIFQGFATGEQDMTNEGLTLGLRWDMHPHAALKFEYYSSKDKSDDLILLGGETFTVDVVTMGIDIAY